MVSSAAPDVGTYLDGVPPQRREVLGAIRELCRTELAGFTEEMAYGMPAYRRGGGEIEFAFASQVQYISVYVLRTDVMAAHAVQLAGIDKGKACVRFRTPGNVDLALISALLRTTSAATGPIC